MAASISAPYSGLDYWNRHKANIVQVTLDNSYPTGGYAFEPKATQGGVSDVVAVFISVRAGVAADGRVYQYDPTNKKIKAFEDGATVAGALDEVVAATDLSTVVLNVLVIGI